MAEGYEQVLAGVRLLVAEHIGGRVLRVLDAGCGQQSYLAYGSSHVTGIDTSAAQLEKNTRLNKRIVGDIQQYPLPECAFDLVVCWDVLEHLPNPNLALGNLLRTVKPAGLLIVAGPNPRGLKSTIAKLTPHRFHIWLYKRLFPGWNQEGPFPTYMRRDIIPERIVRVALNGGFSCVWLGRYEADAQRVLRKRLRLVGRRWGLCMLVLRVGSFGWLVPEDTDFVCVFRKQLDSSSRR